MDCWEPIDVQGGGGKGDGHLNRGGLDHLSAHERNGSGAYDRYFDRLKTGKIKILGVMSRKGDIRPSGPDAGRSL